MNKTIIKNWIQSSALALPDHFIDLLAEQLFSCLKEEIHLEVRLPVFSEEIIPDISDVFSKFKSLLEEECKEDFIKAIEAAPFKEILILAGQRITPGSVLDVTAIPPTKEKLLTSFQEKYNEELNIGTRAWTKHVERSTEKFWGKVKGNSEEKNKAALLIIENIIDNHSWWNTFGHYAQDIVFELRLPSGHGARWKADGSFFIGFLEPFLEGEN